MQCLNTSFFLLFYGPTQEAVVSFYDRFIKQNVNVILLSTVRMYTYIHTHTHTHTPGTQVLIVFSCVFSDFWRFFLCVSILYLLGLIYLLFQVRVVNTIINSMRVTCQHSTQHTTSNVYCTRPNFQGISTT